MTGPVNVRKTMMTSLFLVGAAIFGSACYFEARAGGGSQTPSSTAPAPTTPGAAPAPAPVPGNTATNPPPAKKQLSRGALTQHHTTPTPPTTTGPSATTCLDSGPSSLGTCAEAPDKSCTTLVARCEAYKQFMTPKVAAAALTCILLKPNACTGTADCTEKALRSACPDPAVAQLCTTIAAACQETPANCTALLSGLSEAGKKQALLCATQANTCTQGLVKCLDTQTQPPKP